MNLIKSASEHFEWNVDLGECARIWKGGCIIRAAFLDDIKRAYVRNPDLDNLLVDPDFTTQILARQESWRRVVTLCVASGIAAPAMTASLSYFDAYRRARLPANLVQVSFFLFLSQLVTRCRPCWCLDRSNALKVIEALFAVQNIVLSQGIPSSPLIVREARLLRTLDLTTRIDRKPRQRGFGSSV